MSFADLPDILHSLPKDSVQVMAKKDASKARGEYRVTTIYISSQPYLKDFSAYKGDVFYTGNSPSNLTKYEYFGTKVVGALWWKKTVYVSR